MRMSVCVMEIVCGQMGLRCVMFLELEEEDHLKRGKSRSKPGLCNFLEGGRRMLTTPEINAIRGDGTAAETVEGGSRDNARSIILLIAPAWANASFLLGIINLDVPGY